MAKMQTSLHLLTQGPALPSLPSTPSMEADEKPEPSGGEQAGAPMMAEVAASAGSGRFPPSNTEEESQGYPGCCWMKAAKIAKRKVEPQRDGPSLQLGLQYDGTQRALRGGPSLRRPPVASLAPKAASVARDWRHDPDFRDVVSPQTLLHAAEMAATAAIEMASVPSLEEEAAGLAQRIWLEADLNRNGRVGFLELTSFLAGSAHAGFGEWLEAVGGARFGGYDRDGHGHFERQGLQAAAREYLRCHDGNRERFRSPPPGWEPLGKEVEPTVGVERYDPTAAPCSIDPYWSLVHSLGISPRAPRIICTFKHIYMHVVIT